MDNEASVIGTKRIAATLSALIGSLIVGADIATLMSLVRLSSGSMNWLTFSGLFSFGAVAAIALGAIGWERPAGKAGVFLGLVHFATTVALWLWIVWMFATHPITF